jgi:hypothetical protein
VIEQQIDDQTQHFTHALDLTRSWAVITRGDILVYVTWIRLEDGWDNALVLVNRHRMATAANVIPCVVPSRRAFAWASETCDPVNRMVSAGVFCANLGFSPFNQKNISKIIGIVEDHLQDMLTCPPKSVVFPETTVVAEMEVRDNATDKVREIEVRDFDVTA